MIGSILQYGNCRRYKKIIKNMHKRYDGLFEFNERKVVCFTRSEDYCNIVLDFDDIPPNSIVICEQISYLKNKEISCFYELIDYIVTTRPDVELYFIIN